MSDKNDLEKILCKSKNESDKFFSNFSYDNMNKMVLHKLKDNRKSFFSGRSLGLGTKKRVLAACSVILLIFIFFAKDGMNFGNKELASLGTPVSQQLIKLDNQDLSHWVNFFKINKPDKVNDNLLAVIWESDKGDDYKLVYSSLFEDSSRPSPVTKIDFPENNPSMLVISSHNDAGKYIHYRVLGYKEDKIFTYMEQNYVAGGEIKVADGILIENRLIPNNYVEKGSDGDMSRIVTYYIPYQSTETGSIVLPAEKLKIKKGEYIALVGDERSHIEPLNSVLFLEWESGPELLNIDENIKIFHAQNFGREDLYIKLIKGGMAKKISVEVISDEK